MKWNSLQEAVFEDFRSGKGSTAVSATAGSGKSTVAIACLEHLPKGNPDVLLTSFSTQSIDDLRKKEPPWFVELRTLNSLGNRALTREFGMQKVNKQRAYSVIDTVLGKNTASDPAARSQVNGFRSRVKALVDFAKASLVDGISPLNDLADDYELDTLVPEWLARELKERYGCAREDAVATVTSKVLAASKKIDGTVDFNDQLWLPVVLGLDLQKFDFQLVDEAQDLSPVQIELLCRSLAKDARVFMFGEDFQAIYAWRGAGIGMGPFIKRVNAKLLPLSISYRCPKLVVKEAQKITPKMQSAPEAIDGIVQSLPRDMLPSTVQVGDVILSRKNAPLIGLFMMLMAAGVPVGIQGRDLGGRLIRFVEDSEAKTTEELLAFTDEWARREIKRRQEKNPNTKLDTIHDHVACIQTLCNDTNQIDVVVQRIKSLLMADPAGKVCLSSCHRGKGLEWDRVFLIESSFPVCPDYWLGFAKKGDAAAYAKRKAAEIMENDTEERNIRYVALTRSRRELYFVRD